MAACSFSLVLCSFSSRSRSFSWRWWRRHARSRSFSLVLACYGFGSVSFRFARWSISSFFFTFDVFRMFFMMFFQVLLPNVPIASARFPRPFCLPADPAPLPVVFRLWPAATLARRSGSGVCGCECGLSFSCRCWLALSFSFSPSLARVFIRHHARVACRAVGCPSLAYNLAFSGPISSPRFYYARLACDSSQCGTTRRACQSTHRTHSESS